MTKLEDVFLLENAYDLSIDGIVITDGNGICLKVNDAYIRISGMSREQMIGKSHFEMEKSGEVKNSCVVRTLREKRVVTEYVNYVSTNKSALVTGTPVFDDDHNIVLTVMNVRDLTELNELKEHLFKERELRSQYERTIAELRQRELLDDFVVNDHSMLQILEMAKMVAMVDSSVLITGETGTGKEKIAKYIHQNSARSDRPFITINCGAIPESIAESELFGYEKGAFTGALSTGKKGLIELANTGTLCLDEVGELSLSMQVRLLRVLQTGKLMRVGGKKECDVDFRLVSATNRDLSTMVSEGTFREDLYYRIAVIPIQVPPLRERVDDIIPLADHFLSDVNSRYNLHRSLDPSAYKALLGYSWPGNVREMKNVMERVAVTNKGERIGGADFPFSENREEYLGENISLKERLCQIEREYILKAYEKQGNVRKAAASLGMAVTTYERKRIAYMNRQP